MGKSVKIDNKYGLFLGSNGTCKSFEKWCRGKNEIYLCCREMRQNDYGIEKVKNDET